MNEKKPIIVVEGKTDVDKVSRLVDAEFVITNGSEVSRETIDYIKELSKTRKIIILTDPDYPGLRIRHLIQEAVPEASHAYVDRKLSSNGKKLGVAECQSEEIKRALKSYVTFSKENVKTYTIQDLMKYGLTGRIQSSQLREKIYQHFNLGYGNAKTLAKRLSLAGVKKNELESYLKEIQNAYCK